MENLNSCRINVLVSKMDEAVAFYTEALNLDLLKRYGDHYAEIQAPDLLIGLHPKSEKTVYGSNISIGFGVFNFDTTIENLKMKGLDFRIEDDGYIRLAYFSDPDNNKLFLAENKQ